MVRPKPDLSFLVSNPRKLVLAAMALAMMAMFGAAAFASLGEMAEQFSKLDEGLAVAGAAVYMACGLTPVVLGFAVFLSSAASILRQKRGSTAVFRVNGGQASMTPRLATVDASYLPLAGVALVCVCVVCAHILASAFVGGEATFVLAVPAQVYFPCAVVCLACSVAGLVVLAAANRAERRKAGRRGTGLAARPRQ